MKTSLRLSAYGAALAVLVAGTYAVGTAVGPVSDSSPSASTPAHVHNHGAPSPHEPGGLASTSDGYTLVAAGGVYRAFADFTPTGGPATTLGVDLFAPGDFQPVTHAPSRTSTVDGYTVTLDGDLVAGAASPVKLTVTRDGAPVPVEPYLGADGHLVALRGGDLAYLHIHPVGTATPGPVVGFDAQVPSAGTYRVFFDFQVGGVVRTADFTVTTAGNPA